MPDEGVGGVEIDGSRGGRHRPLEDGDQAVELGGEDRQGVVGHGGSSVAVGRKAAACSTPARGCEIGRATPSNATGVITVTGCGRPRVYL